MPPKTVTVKTSGGDYTSLNAALAGESANLVANTRLLTIADYLGTDTTAAATGSGYTTDETYYINIVADASVRHSGVYSGSKCLLENIGTPLINQTLFTRLTGFQINSSGTGTTISASQPMLARDCLVFGGAYANLGGFNGPFVFQNCLFVGNNENWIVRIGNPECYLLNCTIINKHATGLGISRGSGAVYAKNCYAGTGGGAGYSAGITLTTSASSDAASGSVGLRSIALSTANFRGVGDLTAFDGRLATGSALIGAGTDLSGLAAPLGFNADFEGEARSAPWDVGADKYTAPPPSFKAAWAVGSNQLIHSGVGR